MKRRLSIGIATLLLGCGTPADNVDEASVTGGKSDTFETTRTECSYDTTWLAETSGDLGGYTTDRTTVTMDDIETLDDGVADQIYVAAVQLELLEGSEYLDAAFRAVDDSEFQLIGLEIGGAVYDWVKFYAGDTEVGVVFVDDSTQIVAEVSDGDILGCEVLAGPTKSTDPVCSWDDTWQVRTSLELRDLSRSNERLDAVDAALMSSAGERQLIKAMVHLGLMEEGNDDIFDAFDQVDDAFVTLHDLELANGERYDWIQAYAGDTEVGVVFERGRTTVLAEISDGDVLGCSTFLPSANSTDDLTCEYTGWIYESASQLEALSPAAQVFTADEHGRMRGTTRDQVFRTMVHLEQLQPDEPFEAVFGAADDGVIRVYEALDTDGQRYDWVSFDVLGDATGGVFENNTTNMRAEIIDDVLAVCEVAN